MTTDPSTYSTQLKRNPILQGLTDSEINELVARSEIETFQKGSYFVHEGDDTREMYIILEGSVTLEKYDQSHSLKQDKASSPRLSMMALKLIRFTGQSM